MKNTNLITARNNKKGLTQKELAAAVGISYRSYQYIEAGTRKPNVQTAIAIANFLDCDVKHLFATQDDYFTNSEEMAEEEVA